MKTISKVVVVFFLVLSFTSSFATTKSAEDVVKETADSVIARLASERAELEAHPEKLYSLINELVIPHFDFVSMSKWVLGRNWRDATTDQQDQFVNEFRTLLVRTYAKALLEYSNESINYLPVENNPESTIVVVKTEIHQSGTKPVAINYSMHISGGEWKVVDVTVDGISLVATYRGSFASEIRKSGMDALIAKLTERNTTATSVATQ